MSRKIRFGRKQPLYLTDAELDAAIRMIQIWDDIAPEHQTLLQKLKSEKGRRGTVLV